MPQDWTPSNNVFTLDPVDFHFEVELTGCDVIDTNIEKYKQLMILDPAAELDGDLEQQHQMSISVIDPECGSDVYPKMGDSEACMP